MTSMKEFQTLCRCSSTLGFYRFCPRTPLFVGALLLNFFAEICQATLGSLRLMLRVDFLSDVIIVRLMQRVLILCDCSTREAPTTWYPPQGPSFCYSCGPFSTMMGMGEWWFVFHLLCHPLWHMEYYQACNQGSHEQFDLQIRHLQHPDGDVVINEVNRHQGVCEHIMESGQ